MLLSGRMSPKISPVSTIMAIICLGLPITPSTVHKSSTSSHRRPWVLPRIKPRLLRRSTNSYHNIKSTLEHVYKIRGGERREPCECPVCSDKSEKAPQAFPEAWSPSRQMTLRIPEMLLEYSPYCVWDAVTPSSLNQMQQRTAELSHVKLSDEHNERCRSHKNRGVLTNIFLFFFELFAECFGICLETCEGALEALYDSSDDEDDC
ncbi:hypothetical protein AAMO2058_000787600 [Amorphochlora amoebiformis]